MTKAVKKKKRRMRKQVRKTLGALFLASAIGVAAIPTGSITGGQAEAAAAGRVDKLYIANNTGNAQYNETNQTQKTASDGKVYSMPVSNVPYIDADATIYTTGDGWFQFAYVSSKGSQTDAENKFAVILGFSQEGALPGGVLTIPDTVDAYLQYNDNQGSGTGYVAVGKSGNYLFYQVDNVTETSWLELAE